MAGVLTHPLGPPRTRNEFAAAIGALPVHRIGAGAAEGTFVRANARVGTVQRKQCTAAFTFFAHFQRHGVNPAASAR